MIWMLKEELAEIVQHLSDAQAMLACYNLMHYTPDVYDGPRKECIKMVRKIWFNGSERVLTECDRETSNQHIKKAYLDLMKKDKDNDTKKECTEPVWPGECPAPKPGTETKDGDETIIVPIVR